MTDMQWDLCRCGCPWEAHTKGKHCQCRRCEQFEYQAEKPKGLKL